MQTLHVEGGAKVMRRIFCWSFVATNFYLTRGQARFARRPLVVRLGDSRVRLGLGDSGGDILTLSKNRIT